MRTCRPRFLVTNGFDPLRDVGHAYARKLAAGLVFLNLHLAALARLDLECLELVHRPDVDVL
jgi:hypothetical protein